MAKQIIIDPYRGGNDIGISNNAISEKELTLLISKYIFNQLKNLNIPVKLTRENDTTLNDENRVDIIKQLYPLSKDTIVISNQIINTNKGTEIVYPLRNSDKLAEEINDQFIANNLDINKYYQQRLPGNTKLDYDYLIRETNPNETIIIKYDILNDYSNYKKYADAVIEAIKKYVNFNFSNNYIVKKGDSLYSIANKFNTTVSELKSLNNLSSNLLSIGQILKIPTQNTDSNIYIIKKGDSLYGIASKFNTTISEIKTLNNLSSNLLSIGQTLKIPTQNISNTYTVKKGDSLYGIASKFNTTVEELKILNNLSSNLLSIGQILKTPTQSTSNVYTVKKGDSLYSIASKFNTTINEIKSLNNLSSNLLSIGQILKIPE